MSSTTDGHAAVIIDDPGHAPSPWWALVVVCFAQFMVVLDATITNVALPTIQTDLKISDADLQWVINSYTLAFGGLLLLGGRMSDLLGRRRVFVLGTILFAVASLANGLAWNPEALIFFRGIQGIGAALISPAALSVIMTSFAEGPERTKALGVWSAIAAGGAAVGLLLGGIITETISWEWIFFINVPIGLAVIFAAFRWVPESHADLGHRRFDFAGALTVTAGLMLLVYTIVGTLEHGFTSGRTLGLFAVSVALLVAFVMVEARTKAPLVRLGLLRVRSLAVSNLAMLSVAAGMFAFFFFATLYIQQVLGFEPIKAGAAFLPFAFGIGIGAVTAQVAVARIGVRLTGAIGLAVAASGLAIMGATLDVNGTYWWLFGGMIAMAVGLGWTFVPFTLIATTNVSDDEAGLASGVFNTSQQIGGAIGLAVLATIANNASTNYMEGLGRAPRPTDGLAAAVDGFQTAMYACAGLLLIGLVFHLLFIRKRDVASIDVDCTDGSRLMPEAGPAGGAQAATSAARPDHTERAAVPGRRASARSWCEQVPSQRSPNMQLTPMLAQPLVAPQSPPTALEPMIPILGTPRPPATAQQARLAVVAEEPEPSLGAKLLGGIATKQQASLANQQVLGAVSSMLGARISQLATGWWATLQGVDAPADQQPQQPTELPAGAVE